MELIEHFKAGEQTLAIIIRRPYEPERTEFLIPPKYMQQVGHVVYPRGCRHVLRPISRRVWVKGSMAALVELGAGAHAELTGRENVYFNGAILGS